MNVRPSRGYCGRHRLPVVGLVLVALVTLVACSGGGGRMALTIYSGRGADLVDPLLERFAAETGRDIDVRHDDSAELALLLREEADRSPADVFFSQSPGAVGFLARHDLLAPLTDDLVARVDVAFRGPAKRWVGVSGRQRVLVHNTETVSEEDLPASVFDLADERFAGRVAVAPTNGSFQDFVSAMRETVGEDETLAWLTALAEGGAPIYANNNAIVDAVARGEVPMGLVNHYYALRFLAEDPDLPIANHHFAGDDIGSLLIPATVSVLATADRPQDAFAFIEYLLSQPAQEYFATETLEYPLAAGVGADPALPPLATLELPEVDFDALGDDLEATTALIARSGLG